MSVIVHDQMSVEQALKMLWREANRENIPNEILKNRYRVKPTSEVHETRKTWAKMKRRRRAAKRRMAKKGRAV